ncbi:uncharacterized protein A4U43_C01F19530 [Asparagus officinalis]|uniref:Uncharacterized protein n=1 Tax=Asparagus officinalis TaxID=4686 RepID=A0A5P1FV75_ASPOF|nr:uncharacterized protein A4U43_C01F19530 [Asparagus officinalis]
MMIGFYKWYNKVIVPPSEFQVSKTVKEPIPLDYKEEQVDYGHDDTDAYLTEPKNAGDLGDVGSSDDESDFEAMSEATLAPFPMSSGFKWATEFEVASNVFSSALAFEMTEAPAPASAVVWVGQLTLLIS